MPAHTAFEVVAEDVQAAARDMGREIDFDAAEELLTKLSHDDLASVQRAALRGNDMSDQSEGAVARIVEILESKGLLERVASPSVG